MIVYETKIELPSPGIYIVAHYTGGNWNSEDKKGVNWVVVKLIKGLSKEDREAMPDCDRKKTYCSEDEDGNNLKPYYWQSFGPLSYFGQEIDLWFHLPHNQ